VLVELWLGGCVWPVQYKLGRRVGERFYRWPCGITADAALVDRSARRVVSADVQTRPFKVEL
jgi:uncharacterized membrane protein